MKEEDSLFDLLLVFFEKTLAQIKEYYPDALNSALTKKNVVQMALLKSPSSHGFRVFTTDEQMRLSKASYQFLYQLMTWGVIPADIMELIINRLMFSESRVIELSETKWIVRHTMATTFDPEQLAFFDLVIYQKEHGFALN
jgi:Smg protein